MDFKGLLERYGVIVLCLGCLVYYQNHQNKEQNAYLTMQVDILQDKVASMQAQVNEMNENLKWLRTYKSK